MTKKPPLSEDAALFNALHPVRAGRDVDEHFRDIDERLRPASPVTSRPTGFRPWRRRPPPMRISSHDHASLQ
ncbi:MAG: hypothetical protein HY717_02240 [Planctomycetes bacterium]|nr:hypothetical protein [Planctomycetota bacterium]